MSREIFNSALSDIDYALVEEYVIEKAHLSKRARARRAAAYLSSAAASLVVLFCVIALVIAGPEFNFSIADPNGAAPGAPGDSGEGPLPPTDGTADNSIYTFEYGGVIYEVSLRDGYAGVSGSVQIGEHLGEVVATNVQNGDLEFLALYSSLRDEGEDLYVEIDGSLYFATQKE